MTNLNEQLNEEKETSLGIEPGSTPVAVVDGIDHELENKLDQHDSENEHEDEDELLADYSSYSLAQMAELSVKASRSDDVRKAHLSLKSMRPFFDALFSKEFNLALQAFTDEGNAREDFAFKEEPLRKDFYDAYKLVQQKRAELKNVQDAEKLKNLEEKRNILQKIKDLTEGDESENSLNQLKELQNEWKKIRNIPRENVDELWNAYHVYLDKFYDKLSILHELKELDRRKNLDTKIELIKKVDALQEEPSIKKALISLNKLHEDWKNTGPVPQESREAIWQSFKSASDKVYEKINQYRQEMDAQRDKNLQLKTALCEKAEAFSNYSSEKAKEWIDKNKELEALFEEWRTIGQVPRKFNQSIWDRFKQPYNQFYINKNNFFKKLNHEKNENLRQKTELCEKAEELMNSIEWNKSTKALLDLQAKWKTIGPVHEKQSDKVWKRFRAACDTFFNRKAGHFEQQNSEQKQNLEAKSQLLQKLDTLKGNENAEEVLAQVKEIQAEWNKIGFVPMASKEDIQTRYNEALNNIYGAFRQVKEEMRSRDLSVQYELMAGSSDGKMKLQKEERYLQDKIRKLKAQIETEQNNMGFFANSKNASSFIEQIERSIKETRSELGRLEEKLKLLRNFSRKSSAV